MGQGPCLGWHADSVCIWIPGLVHGSARVRPDGRQVVLPRPGSLPELDPASVGADTRSPINRERWIYGDNSPLRYSDPSGLYPICDVDENGHPVRCPKDVPADDIQKKDTTTTSPTPPAAPSPPVCDQACVDAYVAAIKKQREQEAAAAARKKNCNWWDLACKAKKAWDATTKAVGDAWNFCKSSDICKTVVTVGVGIAVYAGCTSLSLGVGAIGCAVVAGAVSGAVSGALDCKSSESMGSCMAKGAAVGAVTGLIGGAAGKLIATVGSKLLAPAASRVFNAVVSRFSSKAGTEAIDQAASNEGAVLRISYKPGWTDAQKASADAKLAAMNHMDDLVVTQPATRGSAQAAFRTANALSKAQDADHLQELQLGGKDAAENLWGLDSSVNRSVGSQVHAEIVRLGLKPGDRVAKVVFEEWGL